MPDGDLGHVGGAVLRVGRQHARQQGADARIDSREIGQAAAFVDDVDLGAAHVDGAPGQGLRQHQREGIHVRAAGDLAAIQAELLRRDVVVLAREAGADDRAFAKDAGAGDAEIDDLGAGGIAARQDDVVGRDVAMDDAEPVRGMQAGSDALAQDVGFLDAEWPLLDALGEWLAVDEFHRQIGRLAHRIDRKDVVADDGLVIEVVQRRRLAPEQGEHGVVAGHVGADHLDRHGVAGLDRAALVDLAHAADGDQALDLVDAVELRAEAGIGAGREDGAFGIVAHGVVLPGVAFPLTDRFGIQRVLSLVPCR